MTLKVCKFGGSSLASAEQFAKARDIIQSDANRRFVVPSAPGKRTKQDQKITDLLYLCHEHARQGLTFDTVFALIVDRYQSIVADLSLEMDLSAILGTVRDQIASVAAEGGRPDYAASRGEFLNGMIMAELLGYPFIDAAEVIFFTSGGRLDEGKTYDTLARRLRQSKYGVIPGFYGSTPEGGIRTFSRGGSDITGAIVAHGVNADVYENWTDVPGLLMADPRVVDNPRPIEQVTYKELRELAYMGATVLHDEAIFPVRHAGIPVNIRSTNEPLHAGTMIVPTDKAGPIHKGLITGIAGRKDFTVITVEKSLMNSEIGFARRLLSAFESQGMSIEHTPTGIDTMGVVVQDCALDGKLDDVLQAINAECRPDNISVDPELALLATVGRGMSHTPGMSAKLFGALGKAEVNIRMIDQGSSELNIIVGVDAADFEKAMKAIYEAFVH